MKVLCHIENDRNIIKLKKDNKNEFQMSFEGADFYFTMFNYCENNQFIIDKNNDYIFILNNYLKKLIQIINFFG